MRYIKAVDAADKFSEICKIPLAELVDIMAEIPTSDVKEVVHGEWEVKHKSSFSYYVCSECGFNGLVVKRYNEYDFCPNCGADMRHNTKGE